MPTTETETVKVCRKCCEPKPTTEFYRETKGSRGREGRFRAICKDCWNGVEPPVTDAERKEFIKRFVVNHIKQHGETADFFFEHWLPHRYPEITRHAVERAILGLNLRVTRRESTGDFRPVRFLEIGVK